MLGLKILGASFKNYRVLDDYSITFDRGFNICVKPNEAGKSTIIEGITDAFSLRPQALEGKRTKGKKENPIVELDIAVEGEPFTLSVNAQDGSVVLEGRGVRLARREKILEFFESKGFSHIDYVVGGLLVVRERSPEVDTSSRGVKALVDRVLKTGRVEELLKVVRDLRKKGGGVKRDSALLSEFGSEIYEIDEKIEELDEKLESLWEELEKHETWIAELEEKRKRLKELEARREKLERELYELKGALIYRRQQELISKKKQIEAELARIEEDQKGVNSKNMNLKIRIDVVKAPVPVVVNEREIPEGGSVEVRGLADISCGEFKLRITGTDGVRKKVNEIRGYLSRELEGVEREIESLKKEAARYKDISLVSLMEISNLSLDELSSLIEVKEAELEKVEREVVKLREDVGRLEGLTYRTPDKEELERLSRERQRLEENRRVLRLLELLLLETEKAASRLKVKLEEKYLKSFEEKVARNFCSITGGRYRDVCFNHRGLFFRSEDFLKNWQVTAGDGHNFSIDELSDGARAQLLISARLALVELFFERPAFLLLDEPFAFFDGERTRRAVEVLENVVKSGFQVIIFSAKELL